MSHHQRKELIRCAESGHATRIRRLLDAGADTEFVANSGMSPLMTACYAGHTDVVSMLLVRGPQSIWLHRMVHRRCTGLLAMGITTLSHCFLMLVLMLTYNVIRPARHRFTLRLATAMTPSRFR